MTGPERETLDLDAIRARAEAAARLGELTWSEAAYGSPENGPDHVAIRAAGFTLATTDYSQEGGDFAEMATRAPADLLALLAEVERLRAEVERVSPPEISPWLDQPREGAGWRSFEKLSRKSLLNLCYALEAMRDNAVLEARNARAEVERLTAQRDAALNLHVIDPAEEDCWACGWESGFPCATALALTTTPKEAS